MNKNTQAALSTIGTGLAAGAAGYGASSAMGGDDTTSLMTATASGLLASLLAHLITKKTIVEPQPLVGRGLAASTGALAGGTTALSTLGGLAYLDDKFGNKVSPYISDSLRNAGWEKRNSFVGQLPKGKSLPLIPKDGTLAPLARELYKANRKLSGSVATMGTGDKASKLGKLVGPLLRNKKWTAASVAGLATIPLVYKALRGNGSD